MATERHRVSLRQVLALADAQHGVVTRRQLRELGLTDAAIARRLRRGRLFIVGRGVFAVGSPRLTRRGRWMAALLACGDRAVLSYESAAALWGIRDRERGTIEVSVPPKVTRVPKDVIVHRRALTDRDVTRRARIPVTSPTCTLIDLATRLEQDELEAAISAADRLDLVDPERLRAALDDLSHRPGLPALRALLDRRTFRTTRSKLERRFLPIARRAGLSMPQTRVWLNGFEVDFYWPDLGLVVETDGLRYHRTPAQQERDRVRDQAHAMAGLTSLRFTHRQVVFAPDHVERALTAVAKRLRVRGLPSENGARRVSDGRRAARLAGSPDS